MGCMVSCSSPQPFTGVRVITISGHVEDFSGPVKVSDVTRNSPKHLLCSSAHLVAFGSNPLKPNDPLEPGRLYFLLPHAIFRSESSATDLAALMARLRAMAGKCGAHPPELRRVGRSSGDVGGRAEEGGGSVGKPAWKPRLDVIHEHRSSGRETVDSGGGNVAGDCET